MNKTFKISATILTALALFVGVYFAVGNKANGQSGPTLTSEVTNQAAGVNDTPTNTDRTIQLVLRQINDLDQIKLNTAIFDNPEFLALKDISQELPSPTDVGRPNPFAQIGLDVGEITSDESFGGVSSSGNFGLPVSSATVIRTKEIINIGRNSATANAEVSIVGPTARWFEYGTNQNTVNKTTRQISEEPVFSATLTSLSPKTTYYVKSAVDQNGTVTYGELVSFKTAE